ncbi:DUF262 domain-containing protein [Natronorubrum aibiense]|uniref:DUF262 domain-containing protein n=1 Tax=Natronorubrum aibiense TaxID=348826 RepID=A0A5P9P8T0_9EURY|nr:DUF262 domain-containing protein [Natronorubrum aibiense]QFU84290.1 DUF262 domain-containing protein [Natronorubrum aibiense]
MPPAIANNILRFTGEAEGDNQIPAGHIIRDVTHRAVKIEKYTLSTFFDSDFRIPDYQRGYEWEEENWSDLWGEIEELFDADENVAETQVADTFFGSMFFAERDGEEVGEEELDVIFDIIDGQQRITTLTILFKIMADELYACTEDDTDLMREFSSEAAAIENQVYRDVSAGVETKPSLIPNRHHKEFFNSMMGEEDDLLEYLLTCDRVHGNTKYDAIRIKNYLDIFGISKESYLSALDDPDYYDDLDDETLRPNLTSNQLSKVKSRQEEAEEEVEKPIIDPDSDLGRSLLSNKVEISDSNQNLMEAYEYFEDELTSRLSDYSSTQKAYAIVNIKNYILHSFEVGYFEVQNDQPRLLMRIFEILNDRGMELKKADVMRTRIVACFRGSNNRDEYVEKWENIVSQFGNERIIEFLRTYFVVKGEASSRGELKDHLLEAFVRDPEDNSEAKLDSRLTSVDDAETFIDELEEYASYYKDITDVNNRGIGLGEDGDEQIEQKSNRIITRLYNADTSIWEPLVVGVYYDIDNGNTGQQHLLEELLEAIESMAIRKFATMDTHTRDRAYANAIGEYQENGLEGDIIQKLTDIESDDPSAVGANLVEALCQSDWRTQWGKQVLRKIVSANFADEEEKQLILRRLNINDDIVHLEHVFPRTPIRSNSDDEYAWFKYFFRTEEENRELQEMISSFIEDEKDEILEEIAAKYERDLGNLTLLRSQENLSIGNKLFDIKAREYLGTDGFCDLRTSEYICGDIFSGKTDMIERCLKLNQIDLDDSEADWVEVAEDIQVEADTKTDLKEEIDQELEELEEELEDLRSDWTYEAVTANRTHLVKEICELIAFDDDEFAGVDFDDISVQETGTKNDIIEANYRRQLS